MPVAPGAHDQLRDEADRDDDERFRDDDRLREPDADLDERLRDGTFCPFSRASLRPIAIACLRLLTVRPDRPLLSDPLLRRRMADSTVFCAPFPYFAMVPPSVAFLQSTYLAARSGAASNASHRAAHD
jgi:hypothetical protein